MAPLLLVRHGESEGNAGGVIQGQFDLPLTGRGCDQAHAVAERLRADGGVARIVASPLARSFRTAEIIAHALGLPLAADARLMEYDFGEISGLTLAQARQRFPGWTFAAIRADRPQIPGEEGLPVFDARVAGVTGELLAGEGPTVAVTHGGVIGSVLNSALNSAGIAPRLRFRTENCALTELTRDASGRLVVRRHNDARHVRAVS